MALGKLPDNGGGDGVDEGAENIFAEINITPLTDVFLVMLIIFMVSALAIVEKEHRTHRQKDEQTEAEKKLGIKVNLPSGQAAEIDTSKASLVLVVPIDGDVVVGGKTMRDEDLDNLFRAAFQKDKGTQVVLKADKGVQHGRVVNLMERAKAAGLTKLAIGTSGG
jgi:biopolymer transport protein ExbD